MLATPAQAQWTVFDPSNYAQNVLTAARTLQQINNQITSLQNEAQGLINQARNLATCLLVAATAPAVGAAHAATAQPGAEHRLQRPADRPGVPEQIRQCLDVGVGAAARRRCALALAEHVGGLQDAMRVQAGVVGNIDTNRAQMSAVGASQSATGALQATQAGNQLLALQAQQLADLTAVVTANGRAQALQSAGTSRRRRTGPRTAPPLPDAGRGYQPGNAQMFYGNK
jgi:conjugal transfer/entry exclusion protein